MDMRWDGLGWVRCGFQCGLWWVVFIRFVVVDCSPLLRALIVLAIFCCLL